MNVPQTSTPVSDIPEVVLVFEDDRPDADHEHAGAPRFAQRPGAEDDHEGRRAERRTNGGMPVDAERVLPRGRLTPTALGLTLGATAVIGILAVNLSGALAIAGVTVPAPLVASGAVTAAAGVAATVFSPLLAVLVTLGAAWALAASSATRPEVAARGRGRGGFLSALRHPGAAAFLTVMATAWMLAGLVATVTASASVPFVVQAAAFTAALATGLTLAVPAERRLVAGLVLGALAAGVSVLLVLAGSSTVVAAAGSAVVGVVSALLGAAAWNRWFAPMWAARDLFARR